MAIATLDQLQTPLQRTKQYIDGEIDNLKAENLEIKEAIQAILTEIKDNLKDGD